MARFEKKKNNFFPRRPVQLRPVMIGSFFGMLLLLFIIFTISSSSSKDSSKIQNDVTIPQINNNIILHDRRIATTTTTNNNNDKRNTTARTYKVPNFESGGIVIFFHMPKTGGTSFRVSAKKNEEQLEIHSNDRTPMPELKDEILQWSKNTTILGGEKIKLVELHWRLDSLVKMHEDLTVWRKNAKENNIPFFVFTVVRDPVETYLSFYNYFCVKLHKERQVDCNPPWTVDHMISISPDNPQTRWLCHATGAVLVNNETTLPPPIEEDLYCSNVMDIIKTHFNWIGSKHRIKDTLAVFLEMGIHIHNARENPNRVSGKISVSEMDDNSIEIIRTKLKKDQELFDWAVSTFTLEKFEISPSLVRQIVTDGIFPVKKQK